MGSLHWKILSACPHKRILSVLLKTQQRYRSRDQSVSNYGNEQRLVHKANPTKWKCGEEKIFFHLNDDDILSNFSITSRCGIFLSQSRIRAAGVFFPVKTFLLSKLQSSFRYNSSVRFFKNQKIPGKDQLSFSRAGQTKAPALDAQNFHTFVVTDGNPVGLVGRPLHVVDLAFRRIRQDGVFNCARHLLDVPDQCLVIVR